GPASGAGLDRLPVEYRVDVDENPMRIAIGFDARPVTDHGDVGDSSARTDPSIGADDRSVDLSAGFRDGTTEDHGVDDDRVRTDPGTGRHDAAFDSRPWIDIGSRVHTVEPGTAHPIEQIHLGTQIFGWCARIDPVGVSG